MMEFMVKERLSMVAENMSERGQIQKPQGVNITTQQANVYNHRKALRQLQDKMATIISQKEKKANSSVPKN